MRLHFWHNYSRTLAKKQFYLIKFVFIKIPLPIIVRKLLPNWLRSLFARMLIVAALSARILLSLNAYETTSLYPHSRLQR
jgi:hypothetical protein